jgi:hypothetical protein
MTIGIGHFGPAGIFLGSDMELTGVAKYRGSKQYKAYYDYELPKAIVKGCVGAVFSGIEDDMRRLWEDFRERLGEVETKEFSEIKDLLSRSLKTIITSRNSKFQMLVGAAHPGEDLFDRETKGWRVLGNTLSPAQNWEVIGSGDCELSRYLTDSMNWPHLKPQQTAIWMAHILNLSNQFSQQVGQGSEIMWLQNTGKIRSLKTPYLAKLASEIENEISTLWAEICEVDVKEEEFNPLVRSTFESLISIRAKIPKDAEKL